MTFKEAMIVALKDYEDTIKYIKDKEWFDYSLYSYLVEKDMNLGICRYLRENINYEIYKKFQDLLENKYKIDDYIYITPCFIYNESYLSNEQDELIISFEERINFLKTLINEQL